MAARIIIRIEITPQARARLDLCLEKSGMTQLAMLSRLIEWFDRQPDTVQRLVVGNIPPHLQKEVAGMVLKQLERGK